MCRKFGQIGFGLPHPLVQSVQASLVWVVAGSESRGNHVGCRAIPVGAISSTLPGSESRGNHVDAGQSRRCHLEYGAIYLRAVHCQLTLSLSFSCSCRRSSPCLARSCWWTKLYLVVAAGAYTCRRRFRNLGPLDGPVANALPGGDCTSVASYRPRR